MRNKSLIVAVATSAMFFSAPFVTADVFSTLEAEIDAYNFGDIEAEATNMGGSNNDVHATAATVNVRNDASDGTNIRTDMELELDVINTGDLKATAQNMGGSDNDVSATAAVISITNESSR
jgi:acetolactate synthase small subunit